MHGNDSQNVRMLKSYTQIKTYTHTHIPFSRAERVLLSVFIGDPYVAQEPLHVFAVKYVSEEHLVSGQSFPEGGE